MTQRDRKISDKFKAIEKAHDSDRPPPDLDDDEVTGVLHLALDKFEKATEAAAREATEACTPKKLSRV